jgi:hypothetical protein
MKHEHQQSETEIEKPRPASEVRLGMIVASIWANHVQGNVRYNVTFARLYHDDAGWHRSESFGRDELLLLAKVADLAHSRIFALQQLE